MATKIKRTILYILLIILAVVCLLPFLLMMVNATRTGQEIVSSFTLIPGRALVNNWKTVFSYFNLFKGMLNSLIVAVPLYAVFRVFLRTDSLRPAYVQV